MADAKVKCAVLGAGWWGTTAHVPALKAYPHADLIGVQHHDADTARRVAADFEVPHGVTTAEELLDLDGLQAVVISSVPKLHIAQATAALERGLHVLVEKPLCPHGADGYRLAELASERGLHAMVGTTYHWTRHSIEARRVIQAGELGEPRAISILFTNIVKGLYLGQEFGEAMSTGGKRRPELAQPYLAPGRTTYSDPAISGGGQIHTQVAHAAAYVSYLTERRPREVYAKLENDGAPVDVYDAILMTLDDGTLVTISSNGTATERTMHFEVRVHGTGGILEQDLWRGNLRREVRGGDLTEYDALPADEVYPIGAPARNLIDAVLGTAEPRSPIRHGAFASRVAEASIESSASGRPVAF
jgi:predicted dehydrogenase